VKLAYRPEIDGLRILSVICILFYHAEFIFFGKNFFQGGFIGVDFFSLFQAI
jgi:peptidoglycan/LPS O-acetylase OafA/YrhL